MTWLAGAFGFVERTRIGAGHRAQLGIGDSGAVIVAQAKGDLRLPHDGPVTHEIKVRVEDVTSLYERALGYGARSLEPPIDREYGERECGVEDLAGHHWQFTQTLRDVAPEEYGCQTVSPWPGQ